MKSRRALLLGWLLLCGAVLVFAQYRRGRFDPDRAVDRGGVPTWEIDPQFSKDVFTFARVRYSSAGGRGRRWGGGWATDWPDAELNFAYRLQQVTAMKVNPDSKVIELTDPDLADYPFLYMIEPGALSFSDEEVVALRRYLLNGGFMMVDDFWGEREWENFYEEIKRVFPDREPIELSLEHQVFRAVFPLTEKPQMASIHHWYSYRGTPYQNYERPDASEVHYRAIYDDKGRMVVIICHNTDLGDGWEREGESPEYFAEHAEKKAYPMGINIIFYAMTH